MNEVRLVPDAIKSKIRSKSVLNLPNNPSERGFSAEELKRKFANTVIDSDEANAIAQLDRVVNEVNEANRILAKQSIGFTKEFSKSNWTEAGGRFMLAIPQSEHGFQQAHVDRMLLSVNDGTDIYMTEVCFDARFLPTTKAIVVYVDADLKNKSAYDGKIIVKGE